MKLIEGSFDTALDIEFATQQFVIDVNTALSEGWELQGGVSLSKPFITQAVVKK